VFILPVIKECLITKKAINEKKLKLKELQKTQKFNMPKCHFQLKIGPKNRLFRERKQILQKSKHGF
jgi:hypothetical protein